MARLLLTLDGPRKAIAARDFARALDNSVGILQELNTALVSDDGAVDWYVDALREGSLETQLIGRPRGSADERLAGQVCMAFVDGLATIDRADALPSFFSDQSLRRLQNISRLVGRDGVRRFSATYLEEQVSAGVTESAAENIRQLLAPKFSALGSVMGRLEVISVHGRRPRYNIYDSVTRRAVRCQFEPEALEEVKRALGQRVIVEGIVKRNRKGQPLTVEEPKLRVLPQENELPATDRLIGLAPDLTGPMSTSEYIASLSEDG
jgi:hypothetical protein